MMTNPNYGTSRTMIVFWKMRERERERGGMNFIDDWVDRKLMLASWMCEVGSIVRCNKYAVSVFPLIWSHKKFQVKAQRRMKNEVKANMRNLTQIKM